MLSSSTPTANAQGEVSYIPQSTQNKYNAAGQRIKKIENDQTTKYYYSGSATLYTTNANNQLLTENILDLGGSIVASLRFADQVESTPDPYANQYFFYNYDMRGSTTAIIQPDGTLIKGYSYDEFGALEQSGATDFLNEVTFTGSVSDTSSGLQYMNARFYSPSTGRFLSQDTYTGNASEPWTQHLYSYCGNNPVNMVDPTGHEAITTDTDSFTKLLKDIGTFIVAAGEAIGTGALRILGAGAMVISMPLMLTGDSYRPSNTDGSSALKVQRPDPPKLELLKPQPSRFPGPWISPFIYPQTNENDDPDRPKIDIHHIVAQSSWQAEEARQILNSVDINLNSDLNLVPIPKEFHQIMHTKSYFTFVNDRLATAVCFSALIDGDQKSYDNRRNNVINCLNSLYWEIEYRAWAGERWPGMSDMLVFD